MGMAGIRVPAGIFLIEGLDDAFTILRVQLAQDLIDLGLNAVIPLLGLRRPDIEQNRKPAHLPEQLQELGLPVLQRVRIISIAYPEASTGCERACCSLT